MSISKIGFMFSLIFILLSDVNFVIRFRLMFEVMFGPIFDQ